MSSLRFYYLVAWIGPVLVLAATVGLATLLGLYRPDFSEPIAGLPLPGLAALLVAPVVVLPAFWGEEFGWRSYLQQRVSRRPVPAAVITGIVWSVWQYPLVLTDYTDYSSPLVGIVTWTLTIIPQAIILAWLFLRSGSVWVACLAHAGNNVIIGTLSAARPRSHGQPVPCSSRRSRSCSAPPPAPAPAPAAPSKPSTSSSGTRRSTRSPPPTTWARSSSTATTPARPTRDHRNRRSLTHDHVLRPGGTARHPIAVDNPWQGADRSRDQVAAPKPLQGHTRSFP